MKKLKLKSIPSLIAIVVCLGLLSWGTSYADDNMVLSPDDQDAIARLVDDYELIKKQNEEIEKQNVLLIQTIELQKKQLELQKQYLEIEKKRAAFYKELLEEERNNRREDLDRFKSITDDYKKLVDTQKPNFMERSLPILGILLVVVLLL